MIQKTAYTKAQIVGTPNEEFWAQSFVFENDNHSQKTGTLFGVLAVTSLDEKEAGILGKEILAKINEEYLFQSVKPLEKLKKALDNETFSSRGDVSLTLALVIDNVLYLASNTPDSVILKRGGSSAVFFQNLVNGENKTASGFLKEGDTLVLKTSQFSQSHDNEKIMEILNNNSLTETVDILAPEIRGLEDSSQVAAIILKFSFTEIEEEEDKEIVFTPVPEEPVAQVATPAPTLPPVSIKEKIKNLFPAKKGLFHPPMPSLREDNHNKKGILKIIAGVILLLLIGAVGIGYTAQQKSKQQADFNKAIGLIEVKINEGNTLAGLNPNKAKQLYEEGKSQADNLIKTRKKDSPEEKEITALLAQINEGLDNVVKIYKVNPETFFDLTIVKDKASGDKVASFEKNLAILDTKNLSVYLFNTQKKSAEIIGGGKSITGADNLTLYGDNAYVFIPGKAIVRIDSKAKQSKNIITADDWGEIKSLASFGGNLYLLDSENNQIWKYIATDTGFSAVKKYLTEDTVPDFSQAGGMAIDGSIYIAKDDGVIQKFTQGRSDNFNITGLDESLGGDILIFTNDVVKNIYLLEKTNKRLVVLDKEGKYVAQYTSDLLSAVSGFSVDESAKKVFLLSGSKIYTFNLK